MGSNSTPPAARDVGELELFTGTVTVTGLGDVAAQADRGRHILEERLAVPRRAPREPARRRQRASRAD